MRRRLFLMGCVLILGAAVQSCRETGVNPWDKPKDGDPNNNAGQLTKEQLAGTHWQFQRFETATTVSLPAEDFIDLRFEGLNRIGGKAICNVYSGDIELQNEAIKVGSIASTFLGCGDNKLDEEYLMALTDAQSWTATATELRIKYVPEVSAGGSGGVLVFKRLNGGNDNGLELKLKQLDSKLFTLHSFVNANVEEIPVGAENCSVIFYPNYQNTQKGKAKLTADCNIGEADLGFSADGKQMKLSNIGMTEMACPNQATADRFIEFLRYAGNFEYSDYGTTLTIWSTLPSFAESKMVLKVNIPVISDPQFIEIQETPSTGVPANTYPMFYLNGLAFDGKYINVKYKYGGQTNDYRVSAYSAFEIGKSDPPLIVVDLVTDGTNNPISSLTEGEVNIGLDALRKRVLIASPGKTKFRVLLRWDGKPIGEVEVIV